MAVILEVKDLQVQKGDTIVLDVEHLAVESGETLVFIGPNGAGKSTLLLALSQLIKTTQGRLYFQGQSVEKGEEKAYRQHIGLVLQEPLLLDASVFDNIATGLRFRRLPRPEIRRRVEIWMERLGIEHLRSRSSRKLSGGEAQRVSLARAFVLDPDILLLDEPFSALDAPTRIHLLEDFQAIITSMRITALVTTHDMNEALLLGDRVAVLLDGRMQQIDRPQVIFSAPANPDVATFVGVETVVPGKVISCEGGLVRVAADGFQLEAVGEVKEGRSVLLCVRPENITLWRKQDLPKSSARNSIAGRIIRLTPQGPLVRVTLDCGFTMVALITRASVEGMALEQGQEVLASFKASAAYLIPR